jgi:hypothetical protein
LEEVKNAPIGAFSKIGSKVRKTTVCPSLKGIWGYGGDMGMVFDGLRGGQPSFGGRRQFHPQMQQISQI